MMKYPPDPEPQELESDPGETFEAGWGQEPEFTPDAFTPVETQDGAE